MRKLKTENRNQKLAIINNQKSDYRKHRLPWGAYGRKSWAARFCVPAEAVQPRIQGFSPTSPTRNQKIGNWKLKLGVRYHPQILELRNEKTKDWKYKSEISNQK